MSRRRIILFILLGVLISLGIVSVYALYKINVDVVSDVTVINPNGIEGTVLAVYHPGITNFQTRITYALANGLASRGYKVEVTTASGQAPTDLSEYSLLVLSSPTYAFNPAPPIRRYLNSLGDLRGKSTVVICTAAGKSAVAVMESAVKESNGFIVDSFEFLTIDSGAETKATQAANDLALP